MFTVQDIQKDLPRWPQDVIEQWLLYFANEPDGGWPPPDPLGNHRWNGLLGGRPLSWWKNVTWKKQKIRCELAALAPKARADVTDLVSGMKNGTLDAGVKKRIAQPWIHLKDHACFPRALVTMQKPDGVGLIDGTHRMAAFNLIQELPKAEFDKINKRKAPLKQAVWVGVHSAGEVPFT
jgi:hypothetical protein